MPTMSNEKIWACADEMSHAWVTGTLESGGPDQVQNQLAILEDACAITLGRLAANGQGVSIEQVLQSFCGKIVHSYDHLKAEIERGNVDNYDLTGDEVKKPNPPVGH